MTPPQQDHLTSSQWHWILPTQTKNKHPYKLLHFTTWPYSYTHLGLLPQPSIPCLYTPVTAPCRTFRWVGNFQCFHSYEPSASPGSDGFGPGFFKKLWNTTKWKNLDLFLAFHQKKAGYCKPEPCSHRPPSKIWRCKNSCCLQACLPSKLPHKMYRKVPTNQLKYYILLLVYGDRTSFFSGRSISKNFLYATGILNCCHRTKTPTIVVKLDLKKFFDSVCWPALLTTLATRGFPPIWHDWINDLLVTEITAILLNGCPDPWIDCKIGLQQGDPLSPYLFIIVPDVLHRLIANVCSVQ